MLPLPWKVKWKAWLQFTVILDEARWVEILEYRKHRIYNLYLLLQSANKTTR